MRMPGPVVRDADVADFPRILELNRGVVAVTSPLDRAGLQRLHDLSCHHRVAESAGRVVGFVLALPQGVPYRNPNYEWFAARYPTFVYIDRVVVAPEARGHGVGRLLYGDLFRAVAARGAGVVGCEYTVDPPNEASRRFHAALGFREVGRQRVGGGAKEVSLQVLRL